MKVKLYKFIHKNEEIIEVISYETGKMFYLKEKYNEILVNKYYNANWINNKLINIEPKKHMSSNEVKKAIKDMEENLTDIF